MLMAADKRKPPSVCRWTVPATAPASFRKPPSQDCTAGSNSSMPALYHGFDVALFHARRARLKRLGRQLAATAHSAQKLVRSKMDAQTKFDRPILRAIGRSELIGHHAKRARRI